MLYICTSKKAPITIGTLKNKNHEKKDFVDIPAFHFN